MRIISLFFTLFLLLESAFSQERRFYVDHSASRIANLRTQDLPTDDLRVFWWNMLEGGTRSKRNGKNLVMENLLALSQLKNSPDIIILGEFYKSNICDYEDLLNEFYPFNHFQKYNSSNYGFFILSKEPIYSPRVYKLSWKKDSKLWNETICSLERDCSVFDRSVILFDYVKKQRRFSFATVHLLQPWNYLNEYLRKRGQKKFVRKVNIANAILFDHKNPLNVQIKDLYKKIKSENVIVLGDFNVPESIKGVPSYLSRTLKKSFQRVKFEGYTFPSEFFKSGGGLTSSMPKMKIDHAYYPKDTFLKVNYKSILPFSGSDHYPLFMSVGKQ